MIRITQLTIAGEFKTFEYVCGRVASKGTPAIILTIYCPGSSPPDVAFFDEFTLILERFALMSGVLVITGDINVHFERVDGTHARRLMQLLGFFGFEQHVTRSTNNLGGY